LLSLSTAEGRKKYIALASADRFEVIGYYFEPNYEESIRRNETRTGKAKIPDIGIKSVLTQLEPPTYEEGFDKLYHVHAKDGEFVVNEFDNPVAKG
jgi:hypothetical protein